VISVLWQALILGASAMFILLILRFIVTRAIKIIREHERGVVFRQGRIQGGPKGPGRFFLIPFVNRMVKIDLRTIMMDVPPQEVTTRDNISARVNAVIFLRVVDPIKSVIEVEKQIGPTNQISQATLESVLERRDFAQSTLRSVLGQRDFDALLTNRETINEELQKIMDEQTEPWGIEVSQVIVKDVDLPEEVKRDMARRAEGERERRD
jgi:regulator of protease activity HflC (stomatin/prohibitin superfamily)